MGFNLGVKLVFVSEFRNFNVGVGVIVEEEGLVFGVGFNPLLKLRLLEESHVSFGFDVL